MVSPSSASDEQASAEAAEDPNAAEAAFTQAVRNFPSFTAEQAEGFFDENAEFESAASSQWARKSSP